MIFIGLITIVFILIIFGTSTNLFAGVNPFAPGGIMGNSFDDIIEKWARIRTNLDTIEIKASIQTESSGNPNASNPNDPSWGLMGVTKLIARYYLGNQVDNNLWKSDPDLNIQAGSGFLSDLKSKYEDSYPLINPNDGWIQIYNIGETKFMKGIRNPAYQATWMKWLSHFQAEETSGV